MIDRYDLIDYRCVSRDWGRLFSETKFLPIQVAGYQKKLGDLNELAMKRVKYTIHSRCPHRFYGKKERECMVARFCLGCMLG